MHVLQLLCARRRSAVWDAKLLAAAVFVASLPWRSDPKSLQVTLAGSAADSF